MLTRLSCPCLLAISALLTAVCASACAPTITVAAGHPVSIALSEYRIRPSALVVQAGSVTIDVRNYGRLTHDLVVKRESGSQQITVADSGGLAPGQSEVMPLKLKPGIYTLTSDVAIDQSVGQTGTLTVTSN